MKKLNINFVSMHRLAFMRIVNNEKLKFRDVALFHALLAYWNKYRFPEILSVNRQELMSFSKIGSANTYLSAMKNLDKEGFIKYFPSKDPSKGSKVKICLDRSVICQKMTEDEHKPDITVSSSLNNSKQEENYKTPEKKEVQKYFLEKDQTKELAERFFNTNSGRDWYDGKSKIVNWKSYADNYIAKPIKTMVKSKNTETSISTKKTFGSFKSIKNEN